MSTMSGVVDDIRGFNRFYTRVLGLLRPDLAGSAFGLTEARVLFELAHRDDVAVSDLRRDLDLDAGYLSRILSGFTASGLVAREKSAADGRRQVVRLTDDGPAGAFAELDQLQAGAIDTHAGAARRGSTNASSSPRWARSAACWAASAPDRPRSSPARAGRSRLGRRASRRPICGRIRLGRDVRGAGRAHRGRLRRAPTTASARRRGSPSWTVNGSAACSAPPPTRRTPHSCGCCSSSRRRAERASGPGWWTSVCDSPGDPAIGESRCGPMMYCWPPGGSTSGPVSAATVASRTTASGAILSASTGHETSNSTS